MTSAGPRNKYVSSYAAGSIVVVLDPDVAAVFPSSRPLASGLRLSAAEPSLATEKD
jgi:hypothetical protein